MKTAKLFLILALTFSFTTALFAEDVESTVDEVKAELQSAKQDIKEAKEDVKDAIKVNIEKEVYVNIDDENYSKPFIGVVTKNLSLEEAYKKDYKYFYGIEITSVVENSPASKQFLRKGYILMEINGEKILSPDYLSEVLSSYSPNDVVKIKYFDKEKVVEKDFTLGSRTPVKSSSVKITKSDKPRKRKISVGFGGGGYMPLWYHHDFEDVNALRRNIGFSEIEDGILLHGGGGKGNIGNGLFLGGMGAGYEKISKIDIKDENNQLIAYRRLNHSFGMGGVTLDKRIGITKRFTLEAGLLLGVAHQSLKFSQTDGDFNWHQTDANLSDSNNNFIEYSKGYIIVQPKAAFMYGITSWLRLRAEIGYLYGYSPYDGWKAKTVGDEFEVENSPNTSLNAMTISIGPWFGF